LHKIVSDEHPAAPDLRAGDLAGFGALAKFLRMKAQELRGLNEVERVHHVVPNC
jgi:hypothetical protein